MSTPPEDPYTAPQASMSPPPAQTMPAPPQYGAPGMGYPVQARNGLGIAALTLGIIGAVSGIIPLLFWLAGILGILATVFGMIGRGRAKRGEATNKGQATAGLVLGIISLVLAVVGFAIIVTAVDDLGDGLDCLSKADTQAEIDAC